MSGSRSPNLPPPSRNHILDTAAPVLRMAKESVGGLPVPGLEAAIGGAATILDNLVNNKEDLWKLREDLDKLKRDIDDAGVDKSTNEQVRRLAKTSNDLKSTIVTCDKLRKSGKIKRFFQAKRIAARIADVKQSVRDTLQVFQVFSIVSIENNVGLIKDAIAVVGDDIATVGDNVVEIGDNVTAINRTAENAERYNILDKLKRAPARFDADNTPSECMNGTRTRLLDELIDCVKGSPYRFTFVCGIPGSGKSTIAKTVAIRLKDQGLLATSFFFSRNHATRREISLVFSTIAFQLAQYDHEYGDILSKILKEDADLAHAAPLNQLEKLIIYPLSQLVPRAREPWVFLLDALDECGSDRGETILELLSRVSRFPDHVQFFFTGRPENLILSFFEAPSIASITYMHMLDTKLEAFVSDDIRHYLRQSLSSEWRGWHGWKVKDDDLDVLVTRAGGLFIFASTAVKYIRDRAARHDPQTSVNFILRNADESKPRLLDQLYFRIVDDVAPADDKEFVAQYRRVLGTVINLLEPLSVTAIADLLGMAFSDVSRVVSLLSSVLLVSEQMVRIAHLSFSEYITGAIREYRQDLVLDGPTHHRDIADSSIILMNNRLHRNMCELSPPDVYAKNADIPDLAALVNAKISPSLRYACMYWASHFPETNNVDLEGLEKWLDTKILFWLEVLSVCNEVSRAAPLIFDARAQYDKIDPTTRLDFAHHRGLLSDASQFIATFFEIIPYSASHIYYSALPFTPPSSELFREYSCLSNESVQVIKGVDSTWFPMRYTINTGGEVSSVVFPPNGKCIAAACGENIEIRSSESGSHLLTLQGHTALVWAVAFSPDGVRIASGSIDHSIRIWSSDNGQPLFTIKAHTMGVTAVVFSPDGARIASGSIDSTIRIWSAYDGRHLSAFNGHAGAVRAVAFFPDGSRIASGSDIPPIRIWSSGDDEIPSALIEHAAAVDAIVFSPDGTRIASASSNETIRIWSSDNNQLLSTFEGHAKSVIALAFSPNGAYIASGSTDRTIRIWSSDNNQLLFTFKGHAGGVRAVAFSPDGAYIASGSTDRTIRIWSLDNGQILSEGHAEVVDVVVFSPDGALIASGSSNHDAIIQIRSSDHGQLLSTLKEPVTIMTFSPDSARIAYALHNTVRIWSWNTGQNLSTLGGLERTGQVLAIAFSPDGALILVCLFDCSLRVWSSETGELISTHAGVGDVAPSLDWKIQKFWRSRPYSESTQSLSNRKPPGKPSQSIQVDENGGGLIFLPSGELICMIPVIHLPISTSDQFGSILALGSQKGFIILNFSHHPLFK